MTTTTHETSTSFDSIDNEIQNVLDSYIADSTRDLYITQNISFILWLHKHRELYPDILHRNFVNDLNTMEEKDNQVLTKKGKASRKRENIRNCIRIMIANMNIEQKETIPISLEKLTFQIFTRYLSSFKKKIKKKNTGGDENDEVSVRMSTSKYDGECSALAFLFKKSGAVRDLDMWKKLSNYKKGSRRVAAKEKTLHGLRHDEGKRVLSFRGFRLLAQKLLESDKKECIAAHFFLLLDWNLIARAENCLMANITQISVMQDSLCFEFGKNKCDQEGVKNIDHPWHIFANPLMPEICTFLSFAKYAITHPNILTGTCNIFEGASQYERFRNIFLETIKKYRSEFASIGVSPEDFGTHSIRKGAVTLISTGTTVSPPMASICLRANWSLGGVQSRYIKYEKAGDQYVGRTVCGLPIMKKEFAICQPFFDFSHLSEEDQYNKIVELNTWLKKRIPTEKDHDRFESIFFLFKTLIASFFYHFEYLDNTLHPKSPLRSSIFFTEYLPHQSNTSIAYPWHSNKFSPIFSGIPPHSTLLSEIEELKSLMKVLEANLKEDFKNMLDNELNKREIGGTGFQHSYALLEKIEKLLHDQEERLKKLCDYREGETINAEKIHNPTSLVCIEDESLDYDIHSQGQDNLPDNKAAQLKRKHAEQQLKQRKLSCGFHHGRLNPLPSSWEFPPNLPIVHMINIWFCGDPKFNVPPLRCLRRANVIHIKNGKEKLCKIQKVMKIVEKFGRDRKVWHNDTKHWDGARITALWTAIWRDLDPYLCGNLGEKSRKGQVSYRSIYNKMQKSGLFGRRRTYRSTKSPQQRKVYKKQKSNAASQALELFNSSFTSVKRIIKKHGSGALESKKCDFCHDGMPTNHYCRHPLRGSSIYVEGSDEEICGKAACFECRNKWGSNAEDYTNRCVQHCG